MAIRTSRGRFLEILTPGTFVDIPIEVDVYDGANPDTMLATLDGAFDKKFTRELSELGAGSFAIARNDPKATPANMAVGNLIKFKVNGTYRHSVWIEEPATTTVSRDEEGGEDIQINGRGALSYLERAVVYPPQWPTSAATYGNRTHNSVTSSKTITGTVPAGTTIGQTLIAVLAFNADGTGSAPAGWSRVGRESNGSAISLVVYRRVATAADVPGKTYKWTFGSFLNVSMIMLRLANASADVGLYALASDQGTGTSIKNPSVSVGLVDGVLLSFSAIASNTTMTPPAGMSEIADENTTGIAVEAAYVLAPAVGDTGDKTTVAAASAAWAGAQIFIPSAGVVDFTFEGGTFGEVLTTLIDAAQARGAIPFMTYDFTDEVDSHGEPWYESHDLDFHIGTSLLEVWRHLVTLGLEGGMSHSLKLSAYNDASRHFEDSIILRKGHHIVGDVVDITHSTERRTRMLTEGAAGRVIEVSDSPAEVDPLIGRREGYLAVSTTDSAGTLSTAGVTALRVSAAEDRGRALAVAHGLSGGLFEPWKDYREGDWISLDTTGTLVDERVVAITLEETEAGDFDVELELNSVEMDAFLRLNRRLDALMKDGTSTGGGAMSSSGSSSTPGTSKVGSVAGDSAGYLFDKLVTENITKSLVGDVGAQRVKLVATPPASTLDSLTDVDVSSTPPDDGQALVWDDALQLWVPGAGGGGAGGSPLPSTRAKRTSGLITLNSTSWADIDNGLDLVVAASAGNVLAIDVQGLLGAQAVAVGIDVVTVVGGTPVNSVSGSGAADYGFYYGALSEETVIAGHIQYVVAAGDISGGTVRLRLRYKTSSAVNRNFYAGTGGNPQFNWSVVNLTASGASANPPGYDSGWLYVGASGQPAFQNSWVNYGGWGDAAFRRIGNVVFLAGLIKDGSIGASAFTLPVGFRPSARVGMASAELYGTIGNSAIGRVNVYPDGRVVPDLGSSGWYALAGISFPTDDATPGGAVIAPACRVSGSGISVPHAVYTPDWTYLTFNGEQYDNAGLWVAGSPDRIIVPSPGLWEFKAGWAHDGSSSSMIDHIIGIKAYNAAGTPQGDIALVRYGSVYDCPMTTSGVFYMAAAGWYARVFVYQVTGSTRTATGWFSASKIAT